MSAQYNQLANRENLSLDLAWNDDFGQAKTTLLRLILKIFDYERIS